MHLHHLGLPVRDRERSLEFCSTYFGFLPDSARSYPDGTTIVSNADGFDLALHPIADPPAADLTDGPTGSTDFLHFGFRVSQAEAVRGIRERTLAEDVEVDEEPDLVSFKCRDPDGWQVEVYWEQP